jgi:NADH-quinone oxidoreductase subunit N
MELSDLIGILPLIVISVAIVVIMLVITIKRNHFATMMLTVVGLALSLISLPIALSCKSTYITPLFIKGGYGFFYMGLLFTASIVTTVLSYGYMQGRQTVKEEMYLLLLTAVLGSAAIVSSSHFASFFLGLELLSVSLYVLIAYPCSSHNHIEAGVKYLIPAATSAAFLLFGMALVYGITGRLEISDIAKERVNSSLNSPLFLAGIVMIVIGIGFKLALVPFHLWAADVYEGAPAPITGFVATVSKGAVVALLLRYFNSTGIVNSRPLFLTFAAIAIASMFVGNLLALLQKNIKRILAYSSIAHMGYLIVAFLASGPLAIAAVAFYLLSYFATTLGAFGIITVLSNKNRDLDKVEDYRGLFFQHPWLSGVFTIMLFSLAGIPLTAGFIGKFYILFAGVNSSLWLLVILLVINSVIGLFYYLRIITTLYKQPQAETSLQPLVPSVSLLAGETLIVLTLVVIWLGVYPTSAINLIQTMAGNILWK